MVMRPYPPDGTLDYRVQQMAIQRTEDIAEIERLRSRIRTLELGGGVSGVGSVNGLTGVVTLDADGIGETASRVWFTPAEETKLAGIAAGANNYSLPTASASTLGGIKIGSGLSIDGSGVVSASGSSGGGTMDVAFHAANNANNVWTDMPAALSFLAVSDRHITKADLTDFSEARLLIRIGSTAAVSGAKAYLRYRTSFDRTPANWTSAIGTSEVEITLGTSTNVFLDSGWVALASGAKADVFIAVVGDGGDGAADPIVSCCHAQFR